MQQNNQQVLSEENGTVNKLLFTFPHLLINNEKAIQLAFSLLPYSIGFEIECSANDDFSITHFTKIPKIMSANGGNSEVRFRIPAGLNGFIALYEITTLLKHYMELNLGSAIHYHTDCTNYYHYVSTEFCEYHKQYVLNELETWNYSLTYNKKDFTIGKGYWANFRNSYKTLEIRIGEMTFDYDLILKRMIHASSIVTHIFKDLVPTRKIQFADSIITKQEILDYYKIIRFKKSSLLTRLNNLLVATKDLNVIKSIDESEIVKVVTSRKVRV